MKEWKVIITPECAELLASKIQGNNNEDCGLLFASQTSDDRIRVNSISGSCSVQSNSQKHFCELDVEKANAIIVDEFEKSNHTRFYVGEWHTHPEDNPTPSLRDKMSFKDSYHKNEMTVQNIILMAIAGRKSVIWQMYDGKRLRDIKIDIDI